MSLLSAEYGLSLPIQGARDLIADSVIWQALCTSPDLDWPALKALADGGGMDRDLALTRILGDTVYEDQEFLEHNTPPWVLLRHGPDSQTEWSATTQYVTTGVIFMQIELPTPLIYRLYDQESLWNAMMWFQNAVGRLLHEMEQITIARTAGRLVIDSIQRGSIGAYAPQDYENNWVRVAEFLLSYQGVC